MGKEQERLWLDLEYRSTDYDINHSDLLLNVKNASFSIDPAKAIECDVFNYWRNIDCDNCPTKCIEDSKIYEDSDDFLFQDCNTYIFEDQSTLHSVVFSGEVLSSGYTLSFDDILTTGLTFSCSTYTDLLEQTVLDLKNKAVPYLNNIKPNLINLYVFFKLSSVWAKESIISKFKTNVKLMNSD